MSQNDRPTDGGARLPESPDLADVFRQFPVGIEALLDYHDALLRGDSPLSVGERELIAAYVSGLNACAFCLGAHSIIAETFGMDPTLIERLLADPASAPLDGKLRPLLRYVERLTLEPASLRDGDRQAVFAAGWSERALHDAVAVTALFNFMNRLVEGMGVVTSPAIKAAQRERHRNEAGTSSTPYRDYGRRIGIL